MTTLAYYTGVEPSTISRLERGLFEPKYCTIEKLANAFGYNLADFFAHIETIK